MSQEWSVRNIYMYLVSFATLMMVLFGIINFVNNAARFMLTVDYNYYITLLNPTLPPAAPVQRLILRLLNRNWKDKGISTLSDSRKTASAMHCLT